MNCRNRRERKPFFCSIPFHLIQCKYVNKCTPGLRDGAVYCVRVIAQSLTLHYLAECCECVRMCLCIYSLFMCTGYTCICGIHLHVLYLLWEDDFSCADITFLSRMNRYVHVYTLAREQAFILWTKCNITISQWKFETRRLFADFVVCWSHGSTHVWIVRQPLYTYKWFQFVFKQYRVFYALQMCRLYAREKKNLQLKIQTNFPIKLCVHRCPKKINENFSLIQSFPVFIWTVEFLSTLPSSHSALHNVVALFLFVRKLYIILGKAKLYLCMYCITLSLYRNISSS